MSTSDRPADTDENGPIPVGAYVYDREDDDPSEAIVVNRPGKQADEYLIEVREKTVASVNPDYPPDAPVLEVVFKPELNKIVHWDVSTTDSLWPLVQDENLQVYAYPEPRLNFEGTLALKPRLNEDGNRYINRLHVTSVKTRLAFGMDYDGVDHNTGMTRKVCFHHKDRDIPEDGTISLEYEEEKDTMDDLPPLLVGVQNVEVLEEAATPDFLFDL